ncbi:MAG: molybdopterin-binding protein [Candidatus Avoscillospira sp.]
MKLIRTEDAVGHVLCHDLTRIVKGEFKGAQFRKGHVVTEEDIPMLLSMGKENLYVWEMEPGMVHENDGAERLCAVCQGPHMTKSEVKEGKIELKADCDGLFRVDVDRLDEINMIDELMIATRHSNTPVHKGDKLCGTRVIPLVIREEKLAQAEAVAGGKPILEILPYKLKKAGVVTTGGEVFKGLIQDTFTPVVEEKLKAYGIEMTEHILSDDGIDHITAAIREMRSKDVDLILCTGGMSVDPDDNTPGAIQRSGAKIVTYGAPVLPGAMFLLGYYDDGMPVMGLPGCVMFAGATIFDLVLPRVAAGVPVTRREIAKMGNGGLCLGCKECRYPVCPFGKGN